MTKIMAPMLFAGRRCRSLQHDFASARLLPAYLSAGLSRRMPDARLKTSADFSLTLARCANYALIINKEEARPADERAITAAGAI